MSHFKAIIFDKDGTLFDFSATWESFASTYLTGLTKGDVELAESIGDAIGFDYRKGVFSPDSMVIASTGAEVAQVVQPFVPQYSHRELELRMNVAAANAPQAEAAPLVPLLTELRDRGLKLAVATNDAEAPARAHLDQAGVTGFFDFIAGYDSGFGGKPAPGQLLGFASAFDLDPADCVMVGDSTHDLKAGRAAGMKTVGVLTGLAESVELSPMSDVVLPTIAELPAWLDQIS